MQITFSNQCNYRMRTLFKLYIQKKFHISKTKEKKTLYDFIPSILFETIELKNIYSLFLSSTT